MPLLITPTHEVLLVSGLFKVPIGQGTDRDDARRIAAAYKRLPDLGKYDINGLLAEGENIHEFENQTGDDGKWMEEQAERELWEKEEGYYSHD